MSLASISIIQLHPSGSPSQRQTDEAILSWAVSLQNHEQSESPLFTKHPAFGVLLQQQKQTNAIHGVWGPWESLNFRWFTPQAAVYFNLFFRKLVIPVHQC